MYTPPPDDRFHPPVTEPTAQSIVVSYLLVAAVPVVLWAVDNPLGGVVVLAAVGGLAIGVRHARKLERCVAVCGSFSVVLADRVRITVSQAGSCDSCRDAETAV